MLFKLLNLLLLNSSFDIFIDFFVNFLRWKLSSRFSRFSRFRISIDDIYIYIFFFHEFFFRIFFRISRIFFVLFWFRVYWFNAILIKTIFFCLIRISIIVILIFMYSNFEKFRLINLIIFFKNFRYHHVFFLFWIWNKN